MKPHRCVFSSKFYEELKRSEQYEQATVSLPSTAENDARAGKVRYLPHIHGSVVQFQQSDDFPAFREQFEGLVDEIRAFYSQQIDDASPEEMVHSNLLFFFENLFSDNQLFSTQAGFFFSEGVLLLEKLNHLLDQPSIAKEHKLSAIKNIAEGFTVCAPGCATHLVNEVRRLELSNGGLAEEIWKAKELIIDDAISSFTRSLYGTRPYYQSNEIHYVNAYRNRLAGELGVMTIQDDFISSLRGITDGTFRLCKTAVLYKLKPEFIATLIAENVIADLKIIPARYGLNTNTFNAIQYARIHQALLSKFEANSERLGAISLSSVLHATDDGQYVLSTNPKILVVELLLEMQKRGLLETSLPPNMFERWKTGPITNSLWHWGNLYWIDCGGSKELVRLTHLLKIDVLNIPFSNAHDLIQEALKNSTKQETVDFLCAIKSWPKQQLHLLPPRYLVSNLHDAIRNGEADTVHAILSLRPALADETFGLKTALQLAAGSGHRDILNLVTEHTNKIDKRSNDGFAETALMIAAKNGHVECTELLLQAGANPVLMNAMGKKALHLATIANRAHIVRLLRTHGVNLNQLTDQRQTPLFLAAYHNNTEAALALLEGSTHSEVNPNLPSIHNGSPHTPLHCAVHHGNLQLIRALMNKGCDLNSKSGITQAPALFSAITRRRMAVAAVLLNAGADIHATDSNGNNALHVAALNGNFEAVQMLIEASYQQHPNRITRSTYFSSFNLYDLTPAMMAATRGHTPIIQLLFNAGANPLIRNRQGFSANDFLPRMVPMYLVPIPTFYWQPM